MRRLLCAWLIFAGCRTSVTELYARTRRERARFEVGHLKQVGPSSNRGPPPWAAGQYAVWAITADDETTLLEAFVEDVGSEGATVTITTLSPKLRTSSRLSFTHQPRDLTDAREALTQVIRRHGDDPSFTYRFLPGTPPNMRDALEPLWAMLAPATGEGDPKTVTTAAALLKGCSPASARFAFRHSGITFMGYSHGAVPITGFAKGKSSDGDETVELLEYGENGSGPSF